MTRAAVQSPAEIVVGTRRLGHRQPSFAEVFSAGEEILRTAQDWEDVSGVEVQKIAIIGSDTTEMIARAVACGVVLEGSFPHIYQAPFGSYVQEALDPVSGLYCFRPDVVLIAVGWRDIVQDLPLSLSSDEVKRSTQVVVTRFESIWRAIKSRLACEIIQHLPEPPPWGFRGWAERNLPASPRNQGALVGRGLIDAASGSVTWLDLEQLVATVGSATWLNQRDYFKSRLPFNNRSLPFYLGAFRGAWRSARGRAKKVLVLDLDNTLWGGVIGDDGIDGIVLGAGSPKGEAFSDWQNYLFQLERRGVILAVCSKNDLAVAMQGLNHSRAKLSVGSFSAIECSWDDKASMLGRLSQRLNIGLDAFVLADDNPAECELVRVSASEVEVVHLGGDPSLFISRLEEGNWFSASTLTSEDLGRTASYVARAQLDAHVDLASFLQSLNMRAKFREATASDLTRLSQMELKTNQFNMTTRRYSTDQLAEIILDDRKEVLVVSLRDRLADHGIVSSLVIDVSDGVLTIESWLMSCRVFSRTLEQFIATRVIEVARKRACSSINGLFGATTRNGFVANTYRDLGFNLYKEGEFQIWKMDLRNPVADLRTHVTDDRGGDAY